MDRVWFEDADMRTLPTQTKKAPCILRSHRELLLNWFRSKEWVALGAIKGLNKKAKLTLKKAYGYRSFDILKIAIYHTLGDLPKPKVPQIQLNSYFKIDGKFWFFRI